jgi:hypothetical protein
MTGMSSLTFLNVGNSASAQSRQCHKEIALQKVEVLDGQGSGEGKLEMQVQVESGSLNEEVKVWKLPLIRVKGYRKKLFHSQLIKVRHYNNVYEQQL